ncbi:MAG TPA: MtrB/PioB family decaheme-associated outer membrane protein [Verrucomicrobiae bacterium]|nr:MtrB/PioB family decaheme-associated outer membrane protein [Verrucomicrobiae bacterium]
MNMTLRYMMLLGLVITTAAASGQDEPPERGMVETGVRNVWGNVYGRPDLPFDPSLRTSKYNEYGDLHDGYFIRRFRLDRDDLKGSKYFFDLQSDRAIDRDQSYLGTLGEWGRFRVQVAYDEIPHIYSNTTRTPYTETGNGILSIPMLTRNALQTLAATSAANLPSTIESQLVPGMGFIVPRIDRRAGSARFVYNFTPDWDVTASYSREHESGTRPLGLIFNSSPSASLTAGYGAEVPEPIQYFVNNAAVMTEYAHRDSGVQVGYLGSYFQNRTSTLIFDNPFLTADCVAPNGCTAATQGPAQGQVDLYPDNQAHYLNFAATVLLPLKIRLLASISIGWLRQDDPFLPYTSNTLLEAQTAALPAANLHGNKQTLAMNYRLLRSFGKKFDLKAGYRQYDYDNHTPVLNLTPVEGDIAAPNLTAPAQNTPFGYNKKDIEVTGDWYFARKSAVQAGYEGEIMDRSDRDVSHSIENGLFTAVDATLTRDLSFRASYRYSSRDPEHYLDDASEEISGGITVDSAFNRRFDEAARTRNRSDFELSYSPGDRLSLSAFGGTLQDNYNHPGGVNSATPLNSTTTTANPYYLYGVLRNISDNAGFDADFALAAQVSLFADYSWERYYQSMVSRYRVPGSTTPTPLDCSVSTHGCDSANNDWGSNSRDLVHNLSAGFDVNPSKKANINAYYSLSAGKGTVASRPFGDPTLTTGADKFLLTGTNAAVDYPETVSRIHELAAIFKYKLTKGLNSKIEYRYQQFDNKDYQTGAMTPYMGCVSPPPPGAAVPGCGSVLIGTPSLYYPYSVVGDTSAARYLFLGADEPSYRAHYLAGTLEYQF